MEMRQRAAEVAARDGRFNPDEHLSAQQNARLVQNAERYYRTMFAGRAESWNVRDTHMADTLEWLRKTGARPKRSGGTSAQSAKIPGRSEERRVGKEGRSRR